MPVHRAPAERRWVSRALAWAGTLGGAGLTAALGLLLVAAAVAGPVGATAADGVGVDLRTPDDTTFDPLDERSVVYAADGSVLAVLHAEVDRRIVPLEEVPAHVRDAVLAAEDRHFYEHDGFDVGGIGRALLANLRARDIQQGGSTITQQLAKQNFVGADQSLERKVSELLHAVALEDRLSKDELLERYLNQVYFGSGAYGIAAAAEEYFRASPADLTVKQGALLAGILRAPGSLEPRTNPEGARARRDLVLNAMGTLGVLEDGEVERARGAELGLADPPDRGSSEPYVVEAVKRELLRNPAFGDSRGERADELLTGGLRVHTTLEPDLQAAARSVVAAHEQRLDGPSAAVAAVDPRDGRVLALHAGADFAAEQFDLATQGRRQPGSAFKPFVAAAALEDGYPTDVLLDGDSPAYFDDVRGWGEDDGGVRNYGGSSLGAVDLVEATARSVNTAYAQLALAVGTEPVVDLARRTGIDVTAALGESPGPAISLGGVAHGVTPLEMAGAYATFAEAGTRSDPFLVERVEDADGQLRHEHQPARERAVDPAVGAGVTELLQEVVRAGTGTEAQLSGWAPAGKTGTTQNNADAWFVGYVPVMSAAVWLGHPEGQVAMDGITGGSVPASIWQEFMGKALEDVEPVDFDHEADVDRLVSDEPVDVPDVRGMSEREALHALLEARLVARTTREDADAPEDEVVWQSPGPGSDREAGARVELGVSTGTPPPPEPPPEPQPEPEPSPADPEPGGDPDDEGEPPEDGGEEEPPDDGDPAGDGGEEEPPDDGDPPSGEEGDQPEAGEEGGEPEIGEPESGDGDGARTDDEGAGNGEGDGSSGDGSGDDPETHDDEDGEDGDGDGREGDDGDRAEPPADD